MAIYYASKSTANNYAIGNDSNDGLSKAEPFLTLEACADAAYAAAGDHTMIINDGIYSGTDIEAGGYWILGASPTFDSLVVKPETAGEVTIIATSTTAVIRFTNETGWAGKSIEFQDLIIGRLLDTEVGVDSVIGIWSQWNSGTVGTIVSTRNTFYNHTTVAIQYGGSAVGNFTGTDDTVIVDRVDGRGYFLTADHDDGAINISGLTVTNTHFGTTSNGSIFIDAGTAGVTANIANATIAMTIADDDASSDGLAYGIFVANAASTILNSNVTVTKAGSGTWSSYGIVVIGSDALLASAKHLIENCTVASNGMDSTGGAGFGISIAGDLGARVANKADGSRILKCTVTGDAVSIANNLHGIGVVEQDDCLIEGCTANGADIGFLLKLTTTSVVAGCLAKKCGGGSSNVAFYNKGGTNDDFFNNTVIIDADSDCIAFLAGAQDAVNTTGAEFDGNYIAVLEDTTQKVINIAASQTVTFDYNHFYIVGSLPADPFTYQAIDYATVAAWIAARETNGVVVSVNPFVNTATESYSLVKGATGQTGAPKWWTGAPPFGADREPFPSWDISIGAIQSKNIPFHPVNL